jgi:CRISPR/Cas system-associated exonuclease Cas4 (RecB family)
MQPFLQNVAKSLYQSYSLEELSRLCLIFPNYRAQLFFKKYLTLYYNSPIWAPAFYAYEQWIGVISEYNLVTDNLSLTLELYQAWRQVYPGPIETFDVFYAFGKNILKDFNNIDLSLANPEQVFQSLKQAHALDTAMLDWDALQNFWTTFKGEKKLEKKFWEIWSAMGPLYQAFQKQLLAHKRCYYGLAHRKICEQLKEPQQQEPIFSFMANKGWNKLFFIGFYPIHRAGQQLIERLENLEAAQCFWDIDAYYAKSTFQEAGLSFRKFPIASQETQIQTTLSDSPKAVEVLGAPLRISQAQALGQALAEMEIKHKLEETAIILLDPNLLFPVLNALPKGIKKVNVSFQIPLHTLLAYSFLESFLLMHENRQKSGRAEYYYQDVCSLLNNPLIPYAYSEKAKELVQTILKENWVWLPASMLEFKEPLLALLFQEPQTVPGLYRQMKRLVEELLFENAPTEQETSEKEETDKEKSDSQRILAETLYQFYTVLNRILNLYEDNLYLPILPTDLKQGNFAKLFRQIIDEIPMPFTGEPLTGLQILDLHQTYGLDFKHIFFIGMNEGIFPQNPLPTFIPYNLKKAHGLLLPEEEASISAYLFYRILQRAENIHFFYNTNPDEVAGMEKSRYLLQLLYEWKEINPQINLKEKIIAPNVPQFQVQPIEIAKTPAVMKLLHKLYFGEEKENPPPKKISASAINTYLKCRLKFYLNYVANLREEEAVEEEIENATIGVILHKALEKLFPLGIDISPELLASLAPNIQQAISDAYQGGDEKRKNRKIYADYGYNYLVQQAMSQVIERTLAFEQKRASEADTNPYQIWAKEIEFTAPLQLRGKELTLKGKIDRIDTSGKGFLIIDYKSGKVGAFKEVEPNDWEKILSRNNPKPEIVQGLFYAYLMSKNSVSVEPTQIAIYALKEKEWNKMLCYLFDKAPISPDTLQNFEQKITELLEEIFFDTSASFEQTQNKNHCQYCEYQKLCLRDI